MLIELLRGDAVLSKFICNTCSENGVAISLSNQILEDSFVILRVDSYYNLIVKQPDKSPDCLILQKCADGGYRIFIVELRQIRNQNGFSVEGIVEKFDTCLNDFLYNRFGNYFHNRNFNIKSIKLYFISDPYGFKENPERQYYLRGHKLDMLMAQRIPKYFGLHMYIEPHLPSPVINPC